MDDTISLHNRAGKMSRAEPLQTLHTKTSTAWRALGMKYFELLNLGLEVRGSPGSPPIPQALLSAPAGQCSDNTQG